jgi:hypothetical protein
MKTFKQFRESVEQKSDIVNGVPCAIIHHGEHSIDHDADNTAVVNGVPCAIIHHGEHSVRNPEPPFRKLKEEYSIVPGSVKYADGKSKPDESWIDDNENKHIHPDVKQVCNTLALQQVREGLDHHHLNSYTQGSRMLNKELYMAHTAGMEAPSVVQGFTTEHNVKRLDDAINRNKTKTNIHVYSGVGFDPEERASKHESGHIHLPAYTSTSISKHIARNFAATQGEEKSTMLRKDGLKGHILSIHVPKGHPHAYIENESRFKGEKEVLLPRATTVRVTHHTDIEDDFGDTYRCHHAEIVPTKKSK